MRLRRSAPREWSYMIFGEINPPADQFCTITTKEEQEQEQTTAFVPDDSSTKATFHWQRISSSTWNCSWRLVKFHSRPLLHGQSACSCCIIIWIECVELSQALLSPAIQKVSSCILFDRHQMPNPLYLQRPQEVLLYLSQDLKKKNFITTGISVRQSFAIYEEVFILIILVIYIKIKLFAISRLPVGKVFWNSLTAGDPSNVSWWSSCRGETFF